MAGKKQFSIETVFKMVDRASAPIKKISRETGRFARSMKKSFKAARIAALKFTRFVKRKTFNALKSVGKLGFGALAIGTGLAVRSFVSFDKAITSTVAKFGGINLASKEGQKTFNDLKKAARDVGAATEFSATQAAEGLDFLAMAGFNSEQAISALPKVVDLATAANVDFARAVDISSDVLGAFNLQTKDTVQLEKNLVRVNDVLAKTVTSANTNMEDLFESIKKGGPTFKAGGQSIETFSALTGIMANAGIKGSEAGTALRNVMLRLAKPVGEAKKALKDLGVKVKDSDKNFKDIVDIIGQFEKGLKGMGDAQRTATLTTIFGARSVTGMNILLAQGEKALRSYRQSIIDSNGAAAQMAEIMRQSIINRLKTLASALTEVSFKFLETFSQDGKNAIDSLTESVKKIDDADIKRFIDTLKAGWSVIEGTAKLLKGLAEALLSVTRVIGTLANIATFGRFGKLSEQLTDFLTKDAREALKKNVVQTREQRTTAERIGLPEISPLTGGIQSPEATQAESRRVEEKILRGELLILDPTNRTELKGDNLGPLITLNQSGATG